MKKRKPPQRPLNPDPFWQEFVKTFEKTITSFVNRSTDDLELRKDCKQEARLALLSVYPEKISGYRRFIAGEISEKEWMANLRGYCWKVIHNSVYKYLDSWITGDQYTGRTRIVKENGKKRKVHQGPRFTSLEELSNYGMQVDDHGNVSWVRVSTEGLLPDE